jgi:hypothetical protein
VGEQVWAPALAEIMEIMEIDTQAVSAATRRPRNMVTLPPQKTSLPALP